jgi:hypothetical protein
MSQALLEAGRSRPSARKYPAKTRKPVQPKWSALNAPLDASRPDQILTIHEWCQLNRISTSTGRRILAGGDSPAVVHLSPHRIGITVAANKQWQAARERG